MLHLLQIIPVLGSYVVKPLLGGVHIVVDGVQLILGI
jgi:hypothetical protein